MTSAQRTFSFKESEKEQNRLLWISRQRGLPNQSQNCRILFTVRQSIFLNVVFSALRLIGRQTRLPKAIVVSQYILDGTWEHKSILELVISKRRNHPTYNESDSYQALRRRNKSLAQTSKCCALGSKAFLCSLNLFYS